MRSRSLLYRSRRAPEKIQLPIPLPKRGDRSGRRACVDECCVSLLENPPVNDAGVAAAVDGREVLEPIEGDPEGVVEARRGGSEKEVVDPLVFIGGPEWLVAVLVDNLEESISCYHLPVGGRLAIAPRPWLQSVLRHSYAAVTLAA